jgi:hypothetical protein
MMQECGTGGKRHACSEKEYEILITKPSGKRTCGRPRYRRDDNKKQDIKKIGYDDGN